MCSLDACFHGSVFNFYYLFIYLCFYLFVLNRGTFIMEYVGEVLDPKEFRRRAKDYAKDKNRHYYFMALKSDAIIDATMKGNISRFINHSCEPNAETQKVS